MSFDECIHRLNNNDVCILPSETVYGLACSALSTEAVQKVFKLKGRPSSNPLIVHVLDHRDASKICLTNSLSEKLSHFFWPGPLTLVLPKKNCVPPEVTAGLNTVGVRSPSHPKFREILSSVSFPLAAPSANKSNKISPTSYGDVKDEFGQDSPPIIDGGTCELGIESTVLDLTTSPPQILRLGMCTKDQIEDVIGIKIRDVNEITSSHVTNSDSKKSPGQMSKHYCPDTPLILYRTLDKLIENLPSIKNEIIILPKKNHNLPVNNALTFYLSEFGDPTEIAHNLYHTLHLSDKLNKKKIHAPLLDNKNSIFSAINDRLSRASSNCL